MKRMANAIIMASGKGTRMRPLTETTPKPLIEVGGKPMIETVIDALLKKDVKKIVVVVGYLADQFRYLENKYSEVLLIKNNDYETINNISSIYYAKEFLKDGDCFICEADLYISDDKIFDVKLDRSCYFGKYVEGESKDWVFDQDENGAITRVGKVGTDCYNMVGISFFKDQDAIKLAEEIDNRYGTSGYENLFWDEVVNENLDLLKLYVQPVKANQIVEIDTVEELESVEKSLKEQKI